MTTAIAHADTPTRILDAATRLFSSVGVGATSLRAIIREADVNLNAIHYHFGSKAVVTREVFRRVMTPINQERRERLEEAAGGCPTVESLIHAVYWPLFRRSAAPAQSHARRELLVISQLRHDPSPEARDILAENQHEFAPRFEELLERVTGVPEPRLRLAIRFINAAAWGVVTQPVLLDALQQGVDRTERMREVFDDFERFAVAGIERLAEC